MFIDDIHFKLKDGRDAILRSPREEDIQSTLDYLRISAGETEFILRYPEECDKYNYQSEKELFERKTAAPNEVMMVCVVDGKVAGTCDIYYKDWIKYKHRATIGISLISEFWNQGIGSFMFKEMIRIAEAWPQITQMELGFVEGNARARHLYEKNGFRITGVIPNAIRLRNGTFLNEYMMMREVKRDDVGSDKM